MTLVMFSSRQLMRNFSGYAISRVGLRRRDGWGVPRALSTVYVYRGKGTAQRPFDDVFTALQWGLCPLTHTVQSIFPHDILAGGWTKDCAALVFGGGNSTGYVEALGSRGADVIRTYVEEGGAYVGVGAGAYLACRHVIFDKGGPLHVDQQRPLEFFPGTLLGPLCPHFNPSTEDGASYESTSFHRRNDDVISIRLYVNGGGIFLPSPGPTPTPTVTTLARFDRFEHKPAAAVKCRVGERGGLAVLSSPHLERLTASQGTDDVRVSGCWLVLLKQAGLTTGSRPSFSPFFRSSRLAPAAGPTVQFG